MPRKKAVPLVETPEAEMVPPTPEAALETSSAAQPQALEASPVPPAAANEAAVHPEVPEEEPEAGAAPGEDSLPEPQSAPESRQAEVCSPKGLNLRAGPALSYEALAVLPDGMEVTALALPRGVTVPGWELVVAGERAGWASSRFLRLLEG